LNGPVQKNRFRHTLSESQVNRGVKRIRLPLLLSLSRIFRRALIMKLKCGQQMRTEVVRSLRYRLHCRSFVLVNALINSGTLTKTFCQRTLWMIEEYRSYLLTAPGETVLPSRACRTMQSWRLLKQIQQKCQSSFSRMKLLLRQM